MDINGEFDVAKIPPEVKELIISLTFEDIKAILELYKFEEEHWDELQDLGGWSYYDFKEELFRIVSPAQIRKFLRLGIVKRGYTSSKIKCFWLNREIVEPLLVYWYWLQKTKEIEGE